VALKVLLADDSVPAQNMGKKILTDAGYDVLTVGNGLEALRRIADTMPDIAILDIFMPGYTGLEICERLRANVATAELPVILTVGKLEPYRPEDGEHVRSNAVIVKPFAAAELTAAVRSLIGERRAEVVYSPEEPSPAHVTAPLQEDLSATDEKPLSSALAEMPAAVASGEPFFFAAESASAGDAVEEPSGPESLVFNPDAGRTPFSASAVEASPAELDLPAETGSSAFTEFDLDLDAPTFYSAVPEPTGAAMESRQSEPEPSAQDEMDHNAAADGMMAETESAATAAEPAIATGGELAESVEEPAPEEAVCAAVAPVEMEVPALDVMANGTLVEEQEVVAAIHSLTPDIAVSDVTEIEVEAPGAYASEHPQEITLEDGAVEGEVFPAATAEQLAQDEAARKQAFEDLFNSDVPFPLEEDSIPNPAPEMVTPPSLSEISNPELCESELEPEIVMERHLDDHMDGNSLVAPAASPEAVEEFEPTLAVDPNFEGEPQLEGPPSSSAPFVEIEQPPVEGAPVEAVPVEVAPVEVAQVENEFPAPVASPERSELVAEVAKVEALLVQMQAVRQVDDPAGHAHTGAEFRQSETEPYLQSFGGAAQAESAPVHAEEETKVEAAAEPEAVAARVETELPEAVAAPAQLEPEVEPELVSSPLETTPEELAHSRAEASVDESFFASAPANGLHEAERVHKAVELVFDRFKPLLVAAIVRELVRRD
jgi:CheY-like chemotaxis protein